MRWAAWRTLRWHPGSVMGAFVTLVVAATVVGALWFVVDSTDRQQVPVERYAGVPLVVGTGGIAGAVSSELVAAVGGAERGAQESNTPPPAPFNLLWFAVWLTVLVATGMVAAAMGVSIRRRSMEVAVLRAIGARPG
ncbi:hypothetical protein ACFOY2_04070 [Nonomuraea purpurea]|uniref:ABC transporter permease n=1 Tax=Nonomuraea purpurea TaxID=1849276 RepID=A0ABV8G1G3_9ACTN